MSRAGAPLRLVVASANPDKAKEIVAILSESLDVELLPRPTEVPEVIEDGDTLLDNARLKAQALMKATGAAAVADDTGLEVDALGGAPGIYAARYAGEDATYADNVAKVLRELGALSDGGGERRARFKTVALVAFPDGSEMWARGSDQRQDRPRRRTATRASATTPSSSPRAATAGRSPR